MCIHGSDNKCLPAAVLYRVLENHTQVEIQIAYQKITLVKVQVTDWNATQVKVLKYLEFIALKYDK